MTNHQKHHDASLPSWRHNQPVRKNKLPPFSAIQLVLDCFQTARVSKPWTVS